VVADCTGAPAVLPQALKLCRELPWGDHALRGPRYVVQGSYAGDFSVNYNEAFLREMEFIVPRSDQNKDRPVLFDMMRRGAISLKSILSDVRPAAEAPKTYEELRRPGTGLMTVAFRWNA
jgi:threonine dehydrogenase-like Zn-dependent dehydrogenase